MDLLFESIILAIITSLFGLLLSYLTKLNMIIKLNPNYTNKRKYIIICLHFALVGFIIPTIYRIFGFNSCLLVNKIKEIKLNK